MDEMRRLRPLFPPRDPWREALSWRPYRRESFTFAAEYEAQWQGESSPEPITISRDELINSPCNLADPTYREYLAAMEKRTADRLFTQAATALPKAGQLSIMFGNQGFQIPASLLESEQANYGSALIDGPKQPFAQPDDELRDWQDACRQNPGVLYGPPAADVVDELRPDDRPGDSADQDRNATPRLEGPASGRLLADGGQGPGAEEG